MFNSVCVIVTVDARMKVLSRKQITVKKEKQNIASLLSQKRVEPAAKKSSSSKVVFDLTDTEKKIYGNRTPAGYEKLSVLGRGGCALVWLAINLKTEEKVALKQFPKKQSSIGSSKVESAIFEAIDCDSTAEHKGHKYISHLLDKIEDKRDCWLVYELGGSSLSKMLFEVKGEFHNGERIYFVNHQNFYIDIKQNKDLLRQFLFKLMYAFDLLQGHGIVHADIKSDNILVSYTKDEVTSVKIIDFGSAFLFENIS